MGKIIRNNVVYSGTSDNATSVNYDNSVSGLNARTVQESVDELAAGLKNTSVVDNLLSTSTTLPLSANQGRVLDEKINAVSNNSEQVSNTLWSGSVSTWDKTNYITIDLTDEIYERLYTTNNGHCFYTELMLRFGSGAQAVGGVGGNINCIMPIHGNLSEWNCGGSIIQGKMVFCHLVHDTKQLRIWCDSNPSFPLRYVIALRR